MTRILSFRFKDNITHSRQDMMWSRVAQRKRAGPITQRSKDRNLALLFFCYVINVSISLAGKKMGKYQNFRNAMARVDFFKSKYTFTNYIKCCHLLELSSMSIFITRV